MTRISASATSRMVLPSFFVLTGFYPALKQKIEKLPNVIAWVLKIALCNLLMTAAIFAVRRFTDLPPLAELVVLMAVGGGVYFASMAAFGMRFRFRGLR